VPFQAWAAAQVFFRKIGLAVAYSTRSKAGTDPAGIITVGRQLIFKLYRARIG
jgi:hypothetical protein